MLVWLVSPGRPAIRERYEKPYLPPSNCAARTPGCRFGVCGRVLRDGPDFPLGLAPPVYGRIIAGRTPDGDPASLPVFTRHPGGRAVLF